MTPITRSAPGKIRFGWRITRYDPALRDERGAYPVEAWTSISEVGKVYDGEELTLAEYERVENLYADAFLAFAGESGVESLQIRTYDRNGKPIEGPVVSTAEAAAIVRAMLREDTSVEWCKLETPGDDFYTHVGYDLYMYIASEHPCPGAVDRTRRGGLFVEDDWLSPYAEDDD